jgi:hypothetical protein
VKPEQWHRIEELYHAAEKLPEGERRSFLDEACRGDLKLVGEVESLLNQGSSVLDAPAIVAVAKAIAVAEGQPAIASLEGKTFSHYRIIATIGQGARVKNAGDHGADTCVSGFVWREAVPQDHVCVPPETREKTWHDNALSASRIAR